MSRARRLVVVALAAVALVAPVSNGMRWSDGMRWSADRTRSSVVGAVPDRVARGAVVG